jgi:hypothetical protein
MIPLAEEMFSELIGQINELGMEKEILTRTEKIVQVIVRTLYTLRERIKAEGFIDEENQAQISSPIYLPCHCL